MQLHLALSRAQAQGLSHTTCRLRPSTPVLPATTVVSHRSNCGPILQLDGSLGKRKMEKLSIGRKDRRQDSVR